jgi:hypothetical protein
MFGWPCLKIIQRSARNKGSNQSKEIKLLGCKMEVDIEQREETKQTNEALRMQNGSGRRANKAEK